jgi:hypothetical protein
MQVFMSWSGELSHKVARVLKDWLEKVLPLHAWMSSEDISKGANWSHELEMALSDSSYGIVCLVPDNVSEPWIHFEAGAISKSLDGRVCPFLFGLTADQIDGPLRKFQCATYSREEIRKLVARLNTLGNTGTSEKILDEIFDKWWSELENKLDALKHADLPVAGGRVRYLKGRNEIYAHAHQLLKLAEQRVRVVQFFGGPRPPEGYAQDAARILRSKRDCGVEVTYDAYLVVAPSRIPKSFDEATRKRFEIYKEQGVGDLIGVHVLSMEYPEGFGFDMFIVDRKHAHISFSTSERLADLQRGITFENQELVVGDLAEWFERAIERNAKRYEFKESG